MDDCVSATNEKLSEAIAALATREDLRAEFERTRSYLTTLIERQANRLQELIDAIELLKDRDS